MCNETEKHRRWKRYRYFIASLSFSTTTARANRLGVLPLGNQRSQLPTCLCELVLGLHPQTHVGERWGVLGGKWVLGVGQDRCAQLVGEGMGDSGSGPVPARDGSGSCPVPTPAVAAFLNLGVAEQDVAGHSCHTLTSVCKKREGRRDTRWGLLVGSTRGKERAGRV